MPQVVQEFRVEQGQKIGPNLHWIHYRLAGLPVFTQNRMKKYKLILLKDELH